MNKDHSEDMSAILQHHSRLSAPDAANAEMLDLDLTTMTIRSASGVHTIAVSPPMDTFDDRRPRLADMATESRRALGLDVVAEPGHVPAPGETETAPVPVPEPSAAEIQFYPPRGTDWLSFAGVTLYYVCAALVYGGFVMPGSAAWRFLDLVRFPNGPVGFIWLVEKILTLVVGIHVFECLWLDRSRLAPAGLRRGSKVWCLWIGTTFLEGLPAYRRWDRLVKGKGSKRE